MNLDLITAAAVLGGLGILCGVALGLAARFFGVREDPRVEAVRELLPGANCGACGYAGCDDYARAIVLQGAPPDACAPAGPALVACLAKLLGVDAAARARQVALVLCKGDNHVARRKFAYNGVADCASAALVGGGDKACGYGCLGLGSCARICPTGAIEITAAGLAVVHPDLCISCSRCVKACPRHIIRMVPESAEIHVLCSSRDRGPVVRKICTVGCIGCTLCTRLQPESIRMDGALAVVDYAHPPADEAVIAKCPQKTIVRRPGRREAAACG